jgi:outer membrane protein OmpA-like peptidoglycan-associated protein
MLSMTKRQRETIFIVAIALVVAVGLFFGGRAIVRSIIAVRSSRPTEVAAPPPLPEPPVVTYVDGTAERKTGDGAVWELLEAGDELGSDSFVRTGAQSYADVRLQSRSVIRVMEQTVFSLSALSTERIEMKIDEGTVISRVRRLAGTQEFEFSTRTAVAGVRGTELVVSAGPDKTTIYGMSGSVEVYSPENPSQTVLLGVHEKSNVAAGSPPSDAVEMSPQEIDRYQSILDALHEDEILLVSDRITFKPNSAELTTEAEQELQEVYLQLASLEDRIEIIGHTADVGDHESQITLSTERAQTVVDYLVQLGIPESRLSATGVGGDRPVAQGTDSASLSRNRRVEFVIDRD